MIHTRWYVLNLRFALISKTCKPEREKTLHVAYPTVALPSLRKGRVPSPRVSESSHTAATCHLPPCTPTIPLPPRLTAQDTKRISSPYVSSKTRTNQPPKKRSFFLLPQAISTHKRHDLIQHLDLSAPVLVRGLPYRQIIYTCI